MNHDFWKRVDRLFNQALELAPDRVAAFLDEYCGQDSELRTAVEKMLQADSGQVAFLEEPLFKIGVAANATIAPGRTIGAYTIQELLGRGGMGEVYRATRTDPAFEREVAIKVLDRRAAGADLGRRFQRERQILAQLDHPHIARLYEGGVSAENVPYFIMEYVAGEPIDRYCQSRDLSVEARIRLFQKVCSAVHFAHQNLVIHRDLKPGNILVTLDGEPKLLDFGIAKLVQHRGNEATTTGIRPMTPEYASPEQFRGGAITTACDVYSLGFLLYYLLSDKKPYDLTGQSLAEMLRTVCDLEPTRPSLAVAATTMGQDAASNPVRTKKLAHELSGDLDNIVAMAMHKEPGKRYASAQQLSEDLARYRAGFSVVAHEDTLFYRLSKFVGRNRLPVAGTLLSVFLLSMLAAALFVQQRHTQSERVQAEQQRDIARRERDRARQATEFMVDLFEVADPTMPDAGEATARSILDRATERIQTELQGDEPTRAAMLSAMGRVYANLGLYGQAEPLLRDAVALLRAGDNRFELAESLLAYGTVAAAGDRLDAGDRLLSEAVDLHVNAAAVDRIAAINRLVSLRNKQGRFAEAGQLLEQALPWRIG